MNRRFSIVKEIDMTKLHNEIYNYIKDTGKENPVLFMNEDTIMEISNEVDPLCKYNLFMPEGIIAAYCGFKIYSDDGLKFGEVEIGE